MLSQLCSLGGGAVRTVGTHPAAKSPGGHLPSPKGHPQPLLWLGLVPLAQWGGRSCLPGGGACTSQRSVPLRPEPCLSPSSALPPAPPGAEAMASKPEKRVASSVFITLAPPRRHEAMAEEVRQAACEARPGRTRESSAPMKAAGAGSTGRPSVWTPPGRAAAPVPAVPPQLSNGGKGVRGVGRRPGRRQH